MKAHTTSWMTMGGTRVHADRGIPDRRGDATRPTRWRERRLKVAE